VLCFVGIPRWSFFLDLLDRCCGCCFGDSLLEDPKIWKFSFQQIFCGEFWFFVYAYYLFCRNKHKRNVSGNLYVIVIAVLDL